MVPSQPSGLRGRANCSVTTVQSRALRGQGCMLETPHEGEGAGRRPPAWGAHQQRTSMESRVCDAALRRSTMLMAREFLKSQIRLNGSHYPNQRGFDREGKPGNLSESPRVVERKFRISVCVCFLRTQQRAKSQCMLDVQTPVGAGLRIWPRGLAMICSWLGFWFPGALRGAWWQSFNGEFDSGSGRTLAACLTHASRTRCLHLVANG